MSSLRITRVTRMAPSTFSLLPGRLINTAEPVRRIEAGQIPSSKGPHFSHSTPAARLTLLWFNIDSSWPWSSSFGASGGQIESRMYVPTTCFSSTPALLCTYVTSGRYVPDASRTREKFTLPRPSAVSTFRLCPLQHAPSFPESQSITCYKSYITWLSL